MLYSQYRAFKAWGQITLMQQTVLQAGQAAGTFMSHSLLTEGRMDILVGNVYFTNHHWSDALENIRKTQSPKEIKYLSNCLI